MICRMCSGAIEPERLAILPNTVACASCANRHKLGGNGRKARMVFDHKTGGTIQIMSEKLFNDTKRYYVPNGARSAVKNFSRSVCS